MVHVSLETKAGHRLPVFEYEPSRVRVGSGCEKDRGKAYPASASRVAFGQGEASVRRSSIEYRKTQLCPRSAKAH
eukprot:6177294-Pleurochrysis_carterae.AAC.4